MTLTYARIADRVVADEYAAVSAQIDALYGQQLAIADTGAMTRLRHAKPTPGCSATACARVPSNSNAAWNRPAKPAFTSTPAPSSAPS